MTSPTKPRDPGTSRGLVRTALPTKSLVPHANNGSDICVAPTWKRCAVSAHTDGPDKKAVAARLVEMAHAHYLLRRVPQGLTMFGHRSHRP